MKSNFFKYIFILFAVAIIIFSIYIIYIKKDDKTNNIKEDEIVETQQIKDIRFGISNFDTINPLITNNKEVLNVDKLIFEPLMTLDENYKLNLCLASECSKTSSTSYVIKIDNNKKWQDGSSLVAKDIQFTIDRLKEGRSIYSYNVEKVISVEVLDAETIKINLSEEVPFFEYQLTFPILSNNYYLGEDFYTCTKVPMGTGMFKISEIDSNTIKLVKNEKWWNSKNVNSKIEKIEIKIYSEIGELYNSFKLGNIDIFTTANTNLEQYIGTIGYAKTEFKGREFDYLAFNCENSILKDKNVRKAISYAIDKTNIVYSIFNNQKYIADFPLDYGNYLYKDEKNTLVYNQEQAKKILLEDGWEYKNNRWQKTEDYTTKRLSFNITVNSNNENRVSVAEKIKEQLEQIGIRVTIQKVSENQYKNILENKNYEMILTGVYNSYTPDLNSFLGDNNLENYNSEEMQTILEEIKKIEDKELLKEKYEKILEIFMDERPFVGLYRDKINIVKNQNLAGKITGNNYFSYYYLENWYRI